MFKINPLHFYINARIFQCILFNVKEKLDFYIKRINKKT